MLNAALTDVAGMKAPRLIRRILGSASAPPAQQANRTAIRPPAVWGQAEPVWKTLWSWIRGSQEPIQHRKLTLDDARRDFAAALSDLITDDACDLRRRGQSARSLRELWHLRADLYSMVARYRSQGEADRRLQLVNRHFPTSTKPTTTATARAEHLDT